MECCKCCKSKENGFIRPAGITSSSNYAVKDCLKYYTDNDLLDALKYKTGVTKEEREKEFKKWEKKCIPQIIKMKPEIFHSHVPTRFQEIIEDLKNTCYSSYWNKQLGTRRDNPLPFPIETPVETITFGIKTPSSVTAKDSMYCYWDIEKETPRQKYERKIKMPVIPQRDKSKDPCPKSKYDKRGIYVKCCLKWVPEPLTVADNIQADYQEYHGKILGKARKIPLPL